MPKRVRVNLKEIKESNALIHKNNTTVEIEIIDGVFKDTVEIFDKKTDSMKTVNKYILDVIDLKDNKKKEYSTLSKRFLIRISEFDELKGLKLRIFKKQIGASKFDIDYDITQI